MRDRKNICKHQIKVAMYTRFATEEQACNNLEKEEHVENLNNFIKTYLKKNKIYSAKMEV